MFWSHYWRRREPPVGLICGEFRSRFFWKSVLFFVMKQICNGKTKGLAIQYIFHDCLNLHKENSYVFFHYWRSQEPPVLIRCGEFRSSLFWKSVLFLMGGKICNGKTKGLAIQCIFHCFFENSSEICIQYIFHDCLNLHKENAYVFFHYWRSQEPPVFPRCGEFRSSFLKKCIVFRNEKNLQR